MYIDITLFFLGFVALVKGADIMVEGSSSIAKRFGVSSFFIGLTVVAFGTSAPEFVVSTMASLRGSAGIALGNIIGANISNTLLVLGISAVIAPLIVKKTAVNKEIPFSLLAVLAVGIMLNDLLIDHEMPNGLTRIDGLILILFFSIFIFFTFGISREKENIFKKTIGELKSEPREHNIYKAIGMVMAGLLGLVFGGRLIVSGAINIAQALDVKEALIGLTIVAIGTTLPELAASAVAAYRGRTDIAVGNVIGSNIFNVLFVLGVTSVIRPITFDSYLNFDLLILVFFTVLLLFLVYLGRKNVLDRREGVVLISLYIAYIVFSVMRG